MTTLRFDRYDFGEFCRAKTMELCPHAAGGVRIRVKLMLDAHAKMDVRATSALRHKLNSLLVVKDGNLMLPEEPGLEYRGVHMVDAKPWDVLFEAGSAIVTFECADGIAYGDVRESAAATIDVKGTAETYPTFELLATEGDSVMVLTLDKQMFVNVIGTFSGDEKVIIDCESETVSIDGVDARKDVGFYSDFFSLATGTNKLAFAGCSAHVTRYAERWSLGQGVRMALQFNHRLRPFFCLGR